jgi:hypothetical protein
MQSRNKKKAKRKTNSKHATTFQYLLNENNIASIQIRDKCITFFYKQGPLPGFVVKGGYAIPHQVTLETHQHLNHTNCHYDDAEYNLIHNHGTLLSPTAPNLHNALKNSFKMDGKQPVYEDSTIEAITNSYTDYLSLKEQGMLADQGVYTKTHLKEYDNSPHLPAMHDHVQPPMSVTSLVTATAAIMVLPFMLFACRRQKPAEIVERKQQNPDAACTEGKRAAHKPQKK